MNEPVLCHETPGSSIFIKFSIASRWVKNTSWLVETDPPIQIALVCFFPTSKKVPLFKGALDPLCMGPVPLGTEPTQGTFTCI